MQRRHFIQRIAAAPVGLVVTPLAAGGLAGCEKKPPAPPALPIQNPAGHLLWQNWSGLQHAYPAQRLGVMAEAALAAQLQAAVPPIRVAGAGHSFNAQVATEGTLVSVDALSGVVQHDATQFTAVVRAGTRLQQLGEQLAKIGQEMPNLPDINKQTLAGAIATATHGTGLRLQALHGGVQQFRLFTVQGDALTCSPSENPEVFHAALVGLGSFGVVTEYTLKNQPLGRTHRQTQVRPVREIMQDWPRLCQQHRSAEFYYIPSTGLGVQILHDATEAPLKARPADQDMDSLRDLKKLRDYASWSLPLRKFLARNIGGEYAPEDAVDEGWKLLSSERTLPFNEMEYHLPIEHQLAALEQIITVTERDFPEVFYPMELRVVAADEQAWLSPFYQRTTGSIAVHCDAAEDHRPFFAAIEPILRQYGGRPHWGKLHTLEAADLRKLYPRFDEVAAVRARLDPQNRLLNPYLKALWGVA